MDPTYVNGVYNRLERLEEQNMELIKLAKGLIDLTKMAGLITPIIERELNVSLDELEAIDDRHA